MSVCLYLCVCVCVANSVRTFYSNTIQQTNMDSVFTVAQLIEKRREFNLPLYIAFIDYVKAFDRLDREILWDIMVARGFPSHVIRAIQSLYISTTVKIKSGHRQSESGILINQGVRQGCPLSPALFNLYIDHVIR